MPDTKDDTKDEAVELKDQKFYRLLDGPNGRQESHAGGPNKPGYWDEQQLEETGVDPSPIVPAHYFGGEYTGDANPNEVGNVGVSTVPSVDPVLVVTAEEQRVQTDPEVEAAEAAKDEKSVPAKKS